MRIRWTDPAVRDFTNICDYIEKHGSRAAARRVALSLHLESIFSQSFQNTAERAESRTRVS